LEKKTKGGPALSSTGMRSIGSSMSRKSGNRFCDKDMLKQNAPGLFDIVKKVWGRVGEGPFFAGDRVALHLTTSRASLQHLQ
jgi:hypothetical protein